MMELFAIAGPTASGKTSIAMDIAYAGKLEIVSADSIQVYRFMDIGTAKPSLEDRTRVKHHLIDVVDPDSEYTVSDFCDDAANTMSTMEKDKKRFLICGGTGFYLNALINGTFKTPPSDPAIRKELEPRAEIREELYKMHDELKKIDPVTAARIHPNDKYRIVRALEVYYISGKNMSFYRDAHSENKKKMNSLMIVLNPDKEELIRNIKTRTEGMLKAGLVDEVKKLISMGFGPELKPLKSIGYLQAVELIKDRISLKEAKDNIIRQTAALAKRQLTWFKKQSNTLWLHPVKDNAKIKEEAKRFLKC
jgi:tRNA dimethylallyltransferase